jgi:hypothetical protein
MMGVRARHQPEASARKQLLAPQITKGRLAGAAPGLADASGWYFGAWLFGNAEPDRLSTPSVVAAL